jgi:diaminopimelate decarboxylase
MFNKEAVLNSIKEYDSFYMYDQSTILEYSNRLKDNFEGIEFLYSNKTNPNPEVLKTVFGQGFGSDSASLNEVLMCKNAGLAKEKIYYSAPGKSFYDIREAMDISIITADSISEIHRIQQVAKEKGAVAKIGIRINPRFGFFKEAGAASKFGIDEDIVYENKEMLKSLENVDIIGVHVHLSSQELDIDRLKTYYRNMFQLADRVKEELEIDLDFLNLGSGIGIAYEKKDSPLDVADLGKTASELVKEFKEKMPNTTVFIETGRYVVTKAGVYATKVLDRKTSYGKTYVILCNTLNGFVRPSIAKAIPTYSTEEHPKPWEPMFTSKDAFQYIPLTESTEMEKVTLVGNLCTSTDLIADDIEMPKLEYGDALVITNAGSYAAVVTPMQFASLNPPAQLFLTKQGEVINTLV